jgi:kinesin family protein 11
MDAWDEKQGELLDDAKKTREQLKTKLKDDWTAANESSTAIQDTVKSVNAETTRAVDEQIKDLDVQMKALDDFVARARSENANHHEVHAQSVQTLANTVEQSFSNVSAHFKTTFDRVKNLGEEIEMDTKELHDQLEPLTAQVCQPLADLRDGISNSTLHEYQPTGETPQKVQYSYPTDLPRTKLRSTLISTIDEVPTTEDASTDHESIENTLVFADLDRKPSISSPPSSLTASTTSTDTKPLNFSASMMGSSMASLREVNPNLTTGAINLDASTMSMPGGEHTGPLFKRSTRVTRGMKKQTAPLVEGRENLPPTVDFSQSLSHKRKSPRLN